MPSPRYSQIDIDATPYYHCISRCVRRAFLCGDDVASGHNFDHRKGWVVEKLAELADIFAVGICAYAVLSNHFHTVLHIDAGRARAWRDDEVVARYTRLFSSTRDPRAYMAPPLAAERIRCWRARLADLSWFMRCLNEEIARRANAEDDCTGRFWEGRFRSQALLDEAGLLTCMSYVDLNPIRAGMAETLEGSDHTSIQQRLTQPAQVQGKMLKPAFGEQSSTLLEITQTAYIELVTYSGQQYRPGKGSLHAKPELVVLMERDGGDWHAAINAIRLGYRAIGSGPKLLELAQRLRQRWMKRGRRVLAA